LHESFDLRIESVSGGYDVRIGSGSFESLVGASTYDVVFADRLFASRLAAGGQAHAVLVDADEDHKTLSYAEGLLVEMKNAGATRGSHLLAVGGGVVQDLATLAASLYMRGIAWTYVPTTLMAMADSCIGGKSSINAGGAKNLVGNIYPPRQIVIDPHFLGTLSEEALVAGFGEASKICFCRGTSEFDRYLELYEIGETATAALLRHVLSTKKWFIEIDEFDRRERRLLNFGHTFGHALESATRFQVSHGVAVILGMLCAVEYAHVDAAGTDALVKHCRRLLERVPELPAQLSDVDLDRFLNAFSHDKKHGRDGVHLILPTPNGRGVAEVVEPDRAGALVRAAQAVVAVVEGARS
jgi:3-dehydroquinate synthase